MTILNRSHGRSTFGSDPETYDRVRPEYPDEIYRTLERVCGLRPGTRLFEIGPGTGIATRKLLARGAEVTAIEPDARLAAYLARSAPDSLRIVPAPFEDAELADGAFDLGVSATAFHWLEQGPALAKVRRILRHGGWWAMWWCTHYDPSARAAFDRAIAHLFDGILSLPWLEKPDSPFELDVAARTADLQAAGFGDVRHAMIKTSLSYDTEHIVALYSTFSPIQHLPPERRAQFLGDLARITDTDFGGKVERPLLATLYLGQN